MQHNVYTILRRLILWKLGRFTDNIASGHMSRKFRPKNTLHLDLPGFDFKNEIYRANVGEHSGLKRIGSFNHKKEMI